LIQPGGTALSAYDSNVSVQGSGWTTRARASPLIVPTVALIVPACSTGSLATVKVPSLTVPFNPWSDHVAAGSSRRKRPFASKSFARSFYRNAINNGLLPIECDTSDILEGYTISVESDTSGTTVVDERTGRRELRPPLGGIAGEILAAGGLVPYLKQSSVA